MTVIHLQGKKCMKLMYFMARNGRQCPSRRAGYQLTVRLLLAKAAEAARSAAAYVPNGGGSRPALEAG